MAFVQTLSPEEEEQKKQKINAPELSAAGGDITGSTGPSLPSPQVSGQGGFTDVGAYLDANREQASQMGDVVAGNIGTEGQGLKSGIDTDKTGFGTMVQSGSVASNQALIDEILADPSGFLGSNNADKLSAFRKMKNTTGYTGPTGIYDPDKELEVRGKVGQFSDKLSTLEQPGGGYTDYLYGAGQNPTLGQVELDSLLLNQDPTARGKIDTQVGQFKNLNDYLDQAIQGSITEADAARIGTNEAMGQARQVRGAKSDLSGTLDSQLTTAQGIKDDKMAAMGAYRPIVEKMAAWFKNTDPNSGSFFSNFAGDYQNLLNGTAVPDAQLNDLFFPGPLFTNPYFSADDPTRAGVASRTQASRYDALSKILEELDPNFDVGKAQSFLKPYLFGGKFRLGPPDWTPAPNTTIVAQDLTPLPWWDKEPKFGLV